MLQCSCGSVLVSDGTNWFCMYQNDKNWHASPPVQIPDRRTSTIDGQIRIKGKKIGRLVNA